MKPRFPDAGFRVLIAAALLALSWGTSQAQPKSELKRPPPLEPAEGRRQARQLVQDLLQIRPTTNITETLVMKIRDRDDKETEVPVRFEILCTPTNFLNIYQTTGSGPGMKLTIAHAEGRPNEYWLNEPIDSAPRKLSPGDLSLPFAGSDFTAADLGLEFLHWPDQRVVRKEMRRYVFCDVLESINPRPADGGYAKVTSWIGANRPGQLVLVHAEARDAKGTLLKNFHPNKLEKVNGVQELEEMEMRNRQAGTRTKIEFNLSQRQQAKK